MKPEWVYAAAVMVAVAGCVPDTKAESQGAADAACPPGYVKSTAPPSPFNEASVLCTSGADEVVKVGTGQIAFWIDRYEASVWASPDGTGGPKFATSDDTSPTFPKNGQVLVPLYALSVAGVLPAASITWFQAAEACEASGKRLPTGREWLRAARGTVDPGSNNGTSNARCHTQSTAVRLTGGGAGASHATSCMSDWGAEDMIGNLWELTEEWFAGSANNGGGTAPWPDATYGSDATFNVASSAHNGVSWVGGMPAVGARGGGTTDQAAAGIFAFSLNDGPSDFVDRVGFRCVIPR